MRPLAFICFLLPACAPEPASIVFDGGQEEVVVYSRNGIPVKRAIVRDLDGKPLNPQPYVAWNVDHADVVTLRDETLFPAGDGVATVEARVGQVSARYTVTVDLGNETGAEVERGIPYSGCPVTDYGHGVLTFQCGDREFPRGLATYLAAHGSPEVTAVSPLVRVASNDVTERALVTTYLVTVRLE